VQGDHDDLDEPQSGRRMSFLAAAGWTVGLGLVASVVMELTESARPGAAVDLVNLVACRVVAVSVFLFVLLRIYAPDASVRDVLGVRPVSPLVVGLAAVAGALLSPGISLVDDIIYKRFPLSPEETDLLDKMMSVTSRGERLVLFASFGLVIPLFDELFFRGVVFRGLRRGRAEGLAVLGSAMLYGLSHMDLRALPTSLVLGLLAAWLRGRSGSITPAVLASIGANAAPLVPVLLGKGEVEMGGRLAVGTAIGAGVCAWVIAIVLARDGRAEQARLSDA